MENPRSLTGLTWWFRLVGALYVFMFVVCVIVKIPIEVEGPPGVLARAATGDATSRFVVDTWVTLGLYFGGMGAALLFASRLPARAAGLVWGVIGLELAGIAADIYKLARGLPSPAPIV